MLTYRPDLKLLSRTLRKNMSDAAQKLWFQLRRKQICGIQFYRQRPTGKYIVDFYAPTVKLIIEVDGSQHQEETNKKYDRERTEYFNSLSLQVMRFDNLQCLNETHHVLNMIHQTLNHLNHPLSPGNQI